MTLFFGGRVTFGNTFVALFSSAVASNLRVRCFLGAFTGVELYQSQLWLGKGCTYAQGKISRKEERY